VEAAKREGSRRQGRPDVDNGPYIMLVCFRFSFIRSRCSRMINDTRISSTISSEPPFSDSAGGWLSLLRSMNATGVSASSSGYSCGDY